MNNNNNNNNRRRRRRIRRRLRRREQPLIHCQATTIEILKQTNTIIFSKPRQFFITLILSFILFSFQTSAQTIIHSLTSTIDSDPVLKSYYHRHQLQNPLTDRRFLLRNELNSTPLIILTSFNNTQFGFSGFTSENLTVSEVVSSGLDITSFQNESSTIHHDDDDKDKEGSFIGTYYIASSIFVNLGFTITQCCINAIIFVLIVNHFLRIDRNQSLLMVFKKGVYLGYKRLAWFNGLRVTLRLIFNRHLINFFFGDIKDPYTRYKYCVKLIFMPYSHKLVWVKGVDENTVFGFLFSWVLLEMLVSCVFSVFCSVCLADWRGEESEVIREGFSLLSLEEGLAMTLKSLECVVWRLVGGFLTEVFGELFVSFIRCFMEVYFVAVWIVYYFAVRVIDANRQGVVFGNRRQLEGM